MGLEVTAIVVSVSWLVASKTGEVLSLRAGESSPSPSLHEGGGEGYAEEMSLTNEDVRIWSVEYRALLDLGCLGLIHRRVLELLVLLVPL